MPVIDTTALIDGERNPDAIDAFIASLRSDAEPLVIPVQVAIEFAAGKADPAEAIRKLRDSFLLMPCGPDVALEAARLGQETIRAGTFPGWGDIQIAATARHEGMAVVSKNRAHFEKLGLEVIEHP